MRQVEPVPLRESELLTRREMLKSLLSIGAGMAAGPIMPGLAASEIKMQAAIFFEPHIPTALQRALHYAGDDGFVASMPRLLHARTNASYENIIWNTWFTANSEESVVTTKQGNRVVVAVHGGGIFASPERFERSLRADLNRFNPEGLTGRYAAKISEREAEDLLEGKLPDGGNIPVYPFEEFRQGFTELPMRYAVVLDFDIAKNALRGFSSFEDLQDDPLMIVRAGGVGQLAAYLEKARARHDTKLMGNSHPYHLIDPSQPQTRTLSLAGNRGGVGSEGNDQGLGWGYDVDDGMGTTWPGGLARYVAVAPRNMATSLQHLDFEL